VFGFRTVPTGEKAAVWNLRGEVRVVEGPARPFLFRQNLQPLRRYSAKPGEYLVVRYKDGRSEHLTGPVEVWEDPVRHESVETRKCLHVDANEVIVVYRRQGGGVSRRVVPGPALFMPTAEEWLHHFSWHGTDPAGARRKVPHALQFEKLWTIPDQMYHDVEDVRTADDALITVKLMVFFELLDVERMLDQTHDPVADFINAVGADVIDFVAGLSFEEFKERTEALNDLGTYRQLTARAERIGYRINKVVYRGYGANDKLQAMHDGAIESRTALQLEAETQRQAQELEDMKLEREAARAERRRGMELAELEHRNDLAGRGHQEEMRRKRLDLEVELEARRRRNGLSLERRRAVNAERAAFLERMRGMEVDLTRYLVAPYQNPDRLIRIEGNGDGKPQLHLHNG
jgi:hypothetical protein